MTKRHSRALARHRAETDETFVGAFHLEIIISAIGMPTTFRSRKAWASVQKCILGPKYLSGVLFPHAYILLDNDF
ncbi:hypothetical protein BDW72DRAFT_169254 [Aspergillus terricola var. indicus]